VSLIFERLGEVQPQASRAHLKEKSP
jgi:hypothetical protein